MRIKKKSSEFKGFHRCSILRDHKALAFAKERNFWYESAVIAKGIMRGYLKGDITLEDIPGIVSEGITDEGLNRDSDRLQKELLVKCLLRAAGCEKRKPCLAYPKVIPAGNYDVLVNPDAVFDDGETLEVVLYKAGKPTVTMNGRKEDACVGKCLELYFLHLYGRTFVKEGEKRNVKASYYYLRKDTDNQSWDEDFFSSKGKNVVYLEERYTGGSDLPTEMDERYLSQISEFEKGRICREEECRGCSLKLACEYRSAPVPSEDPPKGGGRIILSEAQQRIVDFREGICRVNASAGSGKTECVTERAARMILEGTDISKCLFITFTETGAAEMKNRLAAKCQERGLPVSIDRIHALTFNSFAYRIVCREYRDCGYIMPPAVLDDITNSVIISRILEENRIEGLDYLHFAMDMPNLRGALSCALKTFSLIRENGIDVRGEDAWQEVKKLLEGCGYDRFIPDEAGMALCGLYEEYDHSLRSRNLIRYADQEPLMNHILYQYPGYLERFGYEHIVVDEFQDSNDTQLETIRRLTECNSFKSLMIVGDDSQSVFGFRNTSQENIIHFFEKMGRKGKDFYLTENRRSTPEILDLANKINDLNEEKIEKTMIPVRTSGKIPVVCGFHSIQEEYGFISFEIKMLLESGMQPNDIAVIASTRSELIRIGEVLTKKGIPWIMKNPMFLKENPRIQSAISLAKAFLQPETDIHYFNYLVSKYDGLIFSEMKDEEIIEEICRMRSEIFSCETVSSEEKKNLFHRYLEEIRGTDEIYEYFLGLVYTRDSMEDELEFIRDFDQFGEKEAKKPECHYKGVTLTTAHSSKGMEWKAVFSTVTKFDSKTLHTGSESRKEIEEKRRLLFVALTRARDILYVTGQYVAYGRKGDYTYNQFLRELFESVDKPFFLDMEKNT